MTQDKNVPRVKKRQRVLEGSTHKFILCTGIYITVNMQDGKPFEIFTTIGKAGGCAHAQVDAICRSISIGLRAGINVGEFVKQLSGINCPSQAYNNSVLVKSCGDAIARVLDSFDVDPAFLPEDKS